MELVELPDQVDECTLAEWVIEVSVEGQCGEFFREILNPPGSQPSRNQIALVHDQDEMLMRAILLDVLLEMVAPCSHGITSIDHHTNHI